MSTNKKKDVLWRVYLTFFLLCVFGFAVLGKAFRTQTLEGEYWRSMADSLTIYSKVIEPDRGNIFSANGALLATTLPNFELRMDFKSDAMTDEIFNNNVDSLAILLAHYYPEKSKEQYKNELIRQRKLGNRYYRVRSNLTYPELKRMMTWPFYRLGRYKAGIIVIQKNSRKMPFGILANRTIGYIRDEGNYKVGIEGSFDDELKGESGQILVQRLAGGTEIPLNGEDDVDAVSGSDVYTTIDVNAQDVAEHALYKALVKHNAESGTVILMEVETGKIKAIANLGKSGEGYTEDYNYAIGNKQDPGSTFKLASMIALLEEGMINVDDSVDLNKGVKKYYDRLMRDSETHGLNKVSIKHAFSISSNVGVSTLVNDHFAKKPKKFYEHLTALHLDQQSGFQIKGEAVPSIPKPENWSGVSLPWISVGYEVQLAPIQTLCLYNAVANKGKMISPVIVEEVKEFNKTVASYQSTVLVDKICSDKTLAIVQDLLKDVCINGTARSFAATATYQIAGKTGTTKLVENGRYTDRYSASFAGYFPADNPKYSCIVVINKPTQNGYYGATVAGPVFREVADKIYSTNVLAQNAVNLNVKSEDKQYPKTMDGGITSENVKAIKMLDFPYKNDASGDWVVVNQEGNKMHLQNWDIQEGIVPDTRLMSLQDALYFLENQGMKVRVEGNGKIVSQSIAAGTKAVKGNTIVLKLN